MKTHGFVACLGACLISSSLMAQPTLITELEAGDTWFQTNYAKQEADLTYTVEYIYTSNPYYPPIYYTDEATESSNLHIFNAGLITVTDLRTTLGVSVNRLSAGNQSVYIRNFSLGRLFDLDDGRQGYFSVTYAKSDDVQAIRDSFQGQISFEMTEVTSTLNNELTLLGIYNKKHQSHTGHHVLGLSNKTKLPLNNKLDFILTLGANLITKEKNSDEYFGNSSINYDSSYLFGAEINIHPSKNITLQVSVINKEDKGDFNSNIDFENSENITKLSLISRF